MASKIIHVILRIWELLLSVIVVAILSYFVREVRNGHGYVDPLVIYILVVACISSAYAIITVVPLMVSFLAFPVDFIMFVLWLVAFCLAEATTGTNTCGSVWFWSYWGPFWGGFWRNPVVVVNGPEDVNWAGCGSWRTVIAFCFILTMSYLMNTFIGLFVMSTRKAKRREAEERARGEMLSKEQQPGDRIRADEPDNVHHRAAPGPDVPLQRSAV